MCVYTSLVSQDQSTVFVRPCPTSYTPPPLHVFHTYWCTSLRVYSIWFNSKNESNPTLLFSSHLLHSEYHQRLPRRLYTRQYRARTHKQDTHYSRYIQYIPYSTYMAVHTQHVTLPRLSDHSTEYKKAI